MAGSKIALTSTAGELQQDANGFAKVNTPENPEQAGSIRFFSENDPGAVTGTPSTKSPETDSDWRQRVAQDLLQDTDTFNYTAQNTNKHQYRNTTMTQSWTTGGVITNNGNITTTTTGVQFNTYFEAPLFGAMSLYADFSLSFSATSAPANSIFEIGPARFATANPYAPTDGVYLLVNSGGYQVLMNHNGSTTAQSLSSFTPTVNRVYRFIITLSERAVELWIDDDGLRLHAELAVPAGQGQPFMSSTIPFGWRHSIVGGAAGAAYSVTIRDYNITASGFQSSDTFSAIGNAVFGSYAGLSGGTMGGLANYANSANPAAAVPTNTTATLGSGLGGQFWETDTLAVTTDGIIQSYQAPAGSVSVHGKRISINSVTISSYIQTALTGGGYVAQWSLAFGHTAVSLATAEGAATKAPRRIPLGVQTVAAAGAALTLLQTVTQRFNNPIVVNPGEFIQCVKKKVGTAPSAGVIGHVITFDYGMV